MMKKVVWIYSINADGKVVVGRFLNMNQLSGRHFQAALKMALSPDIEVDFVSYDVNQTDLPSADLYVFHENDQIYLDQAIKNQGLSIAFKDIYTSDIEEIKAKIVRSFEKV